VQTYKEGKKKKMATYVSKSLLMETYFSNVLYSTVNILHKFSDFHFHFHFPGHSHFLYSK